MEQLIPTTDQVKALLLALSHAETQRLAERSGVPFTTLWKIRQGETENPRLETVRQFYTLLAKPSRKKVG